MTGDRSDAVFLGGGMNQFQQSLCDRHLAAATAPRERFNVVQCLVTGACLFRFKQLGCEHQLHQQAGAGNYVRPVGVTNGA